jgi:DNA-directed RNA polymerase subunit beta'
VTRAYTSGAAHLQAKVKVRITEHLPNAEGKLEGKTRIVDTTIGRALLFRILPKGLPFEIVNRPMKKKAISNLINTAYRTVGLKDTVILADQVMYTGFQYATRSGSSIGVNDFVIPAAKAKIVADAEAEVKEIESQFASGLVTHGEKYNKVIDIWSRANELVAKAMMENLGKEKVIDRNGNEVDQESFNSVYMMADSGARGSAAQIRQLFPNSELLRECSA